MPKENYRNLQTSSKTHKTKDRTTSTILFQGFKLKTSRPINQNAQKTTKPQDDWQRQKETINIQLKQLTTEPEYTPQTTTHFDNNEPPQESYYELMRDAPDKYLSDNTQPSPAPTDDLPDIHHPNIFSCNEQKQPLLDEDISNHIQFDQKRNLSYLPMSTSLTLKRKRHMYYMSMDFEKLTLDGLIDTGALTSAISEQDLNKIKLIANEPMKQ